MIGLMRFISLTIVSLIGTITSVAFFWSEYGFFKGIFFGFLMGLLFISISVFVGARAGNSRNDITGVDLALPLFVSIVSATLFFPAGLLFANLFSVFTCIGSGILLSGALLAYKARHLHGAALALPYMTFFYEILPIDIPSDFDNILCFGGSATSLILGKMLSAPDVETKELDVVDFTEEKTKIPEFNVSERKLLSDAEDTSLSLKK